MALVCGNKHAAAGRGRWKLYGTNHHGRQDVGLRVWPGDKTSVFGVEVCWFPEAKESSPRQVRSKVKVMLIVFLDMEGIVHYEYVPQGQTVNYQFYLQVLKCLRLAVSRKRPQKRAAGAWALHHDNASAHTAHFIQVFLARPGIPVVQQSPYSPDMAPCDFWLFPQLKTVLKGKRFEDIDAIKKNTTITLNTIPKDSFKKCFQQWQDRWKQCASSQESILKIIKYFNHKQ